VRWINQGVFQTKANFFELNHPNKPDQNAQQSKKQLKKRNPYKNHYFQSDGK